MLLLRAFVRPCSRGVQSVARSFAVEKSGGVDTWKMDGSAVARAIRARIRQRTDEARWLLYRRPQLAVVLVGERADSAKYVALKQQAARDCGIRTVDVRVSSSHDEEDLVRHVRRLDADPAIDGVLVQLPLPRKMNQARVLSAISAEKDVDGFHPQNLGALALVGEAHRRRFMTDACTRTSSEANVPALPLASLPFNVPCTALACIELLDHYGVDLAGKHAVVVGRSNIVGLPTALLALHRDATVTTCHIRTKDLAARVREADLVIAAAGSPELIRGSWLKPGAVVIDVGFNLTLDPGSSTSRICGDVAFDEAAKVASLITPVPGGVGPMTVAMLMQNTLFSFFRRNGVDPSLELECDGRVGVY